MEIKYTRQGDYLIPNLYLENDEDCGRIGKVFQSTGMEWSY